jgi:hypothetical protein
MLFVFIRLLPPPPPSPKAFLSLLHFISLLCCRIYFASSIGSAARRGAGERWAARLLCLVGVDRELGAVAGEVQADVAFMISSAWCAGLYASHVSLCLVGRRDIGTPLAESALPCLPVLCWGVSCCQVRGRLRVSHELPLSGCRRSVRTPSTGPPLPCVPT